MNKPTITLTVGPSASGKSSWAEKKENSWFSPTTPIVNNINRDDIRFELFTEGERSWVKYKFNKANEKAVTEVVDKRVQFALDEREHIILSDTNLNPKIRLKWQEWALANDYEYKELMKRNAQREGGLTENLLWSQYKRYMQQFGIIGEHKVELYKADEDLAYTSIVDLDGSIADMTGIRKPFEWGKVGQDLVRTTIVDMVIGTGIRTGHITFMSGRDGCCYEDTYAWLEKALNGYEKAFEWDLHMRTAKDSRKDDIVKYELFNDHVRSKYNVESVVDDRLSIIRLWSVLGLPNIVNVGNYMDEF